MTHIEHLLACASWRLRAYLASPDIDSDRVGWRGDADSCVVAEWLRFEYALLVRWEDTVAVDTMQVIAYDQRSCMPFLLALFIEEIDSARHYNGGCGLRWFISKIDSERKILAALTIPTAVSRDEALAALAAAEHLAAQRQLTEHSQDRQCVYLDQLGRPCFREAVTPWFHSFFTHNLEPHPVREACIEFAGRLCAEHWPYVIVPPAHWWNQECDAHSATTMVERELESARA